MPGSGGRLTRQKIARAPLTSYYRGNTKQSAPSPFRPSAPQKKLRALFGRVIRVSVATVLLGLLIFSLSVKPQPKLITDSELYHPASVYQSAAAAGLDNFKDHNKLTFDSASLAARLKKQFPEIAAINVELPVFARQPVIRLSIASPKFLFNSHGQTYIISSEGVIVSDNLNISGVRSLPVVTDRSGFAVKLGQAALSASQVNFINQVVEQSTRAKVPIKSLTLPPHVQELDMATKDAGYFTKFYMGGDPLVEAGQFLAARHQFAQMHKQPTRYLDVRVAGKIFYK